MTIRWQIWFLVSFLICASWTIYDSTGAKDRGRVQAEQNWEWVQKNKQTSLASYCEKNGLSAYQNQALEAKTGIFNAENPLYCVDSLEEAKRLYASHAQKVAKDKSIKITFSFIGVWLGIIVFFTVFSRIYNRIVTKKTRNVKTKS